MPRRDERPRGSVDDELAALRAEVARLKNAGHPEPGAAPGPPAVARAPSFVSDPVWRAKVTADLETAAGLGVPMDVVAAYGGIAPRTLRDWMANGKAGIAPYVELYERVRAARAKNEVRVLGVQYRIASLQVEVVEEEVRADGTRVTRRMPADPGALSAIQRASAWILEHVHGYYRTERHVLDPGGTTPPRSDEEVQAYLDRIAERRAQARGLAATPQDGDGNEPR